MAWLYEVSTRTDQWTTGKASNIYHLINDECHLIIYIQHFTKGNMDMMETNGSGHTVSSILITKVVRTWTILGQFEVFISTTSLL